MTIALPELSSVAGGVGGFQAAVSAAYFPFEITQTAGTDAFHSRIATSAIGPLQLSRIYVSGAFVGRRRMSDRADERAAYVLMLLEEGGQVSLRGKRSALSSPGDLIMIDANRPLDTEQRAGGTSLAVSIPAALLKERFLGVDDWCLSPLPTGEGAGAILRDCLLCYWRAKAQLRGSASGDLAGALVHLIGAAFRDSRQVPMFNSHSMGLHFLRMRDLVASQLDSENLSVDYVASRLGISKSYLFMIMSAANTTLGRFILEQRLERSRELLSDPALSKRQISDIAFSVGFQDLSHFSRRFSERYGHSPRIFRSKVCGPEPDRD